MSDVKPEDGPDMMMMMMMNIRINIFHQIHMNSLRTLRTILKKLPLESEERKKKEIKIQLRAHPL